MAFVEHCHIQHGVMSPHFWAGTCSVAHLFLGSDKNIGMPHNYAFLAVKPLAPKGLIVPVTRLWQFPPALPQHPVKVRQHKNKICL